MKPSVIPLTALALAALPIVTVAAGDDQLEEIVVTAQKRSERLQDVPAAITAVSGDALNELHLQGNADLARSVPKGMKWKLRANVGDRLRWYELPEEVGH